MRYEAVLRYGTNASGYEYVFARNLREGGAVKERDNMVNMTRENMTEHCHGGRVVTGSMADDPNAVMVCAMHPDGMNYIKVVTFREVRPDPDLSDPLLASLIAVNSGTL